MFGVGALDIIMLLLLPVDILKYFLAYGYRENNLISAREVTQNYYVRERLCALVYSSCERFE